MEAQIELSPFLEGTNVQYAWDSTSLGLLKRCPRLYQYTMIDGYEDKEESIHLRFGIEFHESMNEYDNLMVEGYTHDDAVRETVYHLLLRTDGWEPSPTLKNADKKNRTTLVRTVILYLDEYENDEVETLILPSGEPALEQSFRFELDWGPETARNEKGHWLPDQPYVLCGHLDKVVTYLDDKFGMDYKTTTWPIYSKFFEQFEPDNQMSLYTLAMKIIFNVPVKGMIINAIQVGAQFAKFARGVTYRTADQLEEWLNDLKVILNEAEGYARRNYWPQRDTSCDKYGGCKFREVCSQSPSVRSLVLDGQYTKLTEKEKWNPLRKR